MGTADVLRSGGMERAGALAWQSVPRRVRSPTGLPHVSFSVSSNASPCAAAFHGLRGDAGRICFSATGSWSQCFSPFSCSILRRESAIAATDVYGRSDESSDGVGGGVADETLDRCRSRDWRTRRLYGIRVRKCGCLSAPCRHGFLLLCWDWDAESDDWCISRGEHLPGQSYSSEAARISAGDLRIHAPDGSGADESGSDHV